MELNFDKTVPEIHRISWVQYTHEQAIKEFACDNLTGLIYQIKELEVWLDL